MSVYELSGCGYEYCCCQKKKKKKKKYISQNNNKVTLTNVFISLDINIFYSNNNNKNKHKKNICRTMIFHENVNLILLLLFREVGTDSLTD